MKTYKMKCEIVNLPSDALTQCKEQIKQLQDQINALGASTERNALLDELVSFFTFSACRVTPTFCS